MVETALCLKLKFWSALMKIYISIFFIYLFEDKRAFLVSLDQDMILISPPRNLNFNYLRSKILKVVLNSPLAMIWYDGLTKSEKDKHKMR